MEYIPGNHSMHMLTYHIIFVVKYRKPVISDEIGNHMKEYVKYLLELNKCKTALSKDAHKLYNGEISKYLHGENCPLWSPSYFIATTGSVSMDTVRQYIESQRAEEHKRKYTFRVRKKRQQ